MATISGIDLGVGNKPFNSGAAFRLQKGASRDVVIPLANGIEAVTRGKQSFLVVRLPSVPATTDQLLVNAHDAAQQALDILSVKGIDHLELPEAHDEHILWWRHDNHTILRIVQIGVFGFSASATATVVGADGTPIPSSPPPPTQWHDAFRYYRLSQTTDDLFDSYRNLFLAFESVLSTAVPLQHREGERAWLDRALRTVSATVNLTPYARPGASDLVQEIIDEQYTAHRCAIDHAKMGRPHILPGSASEREQVTEALQRLGLLVRELNRVYLHVTSASSMLSPHAFGNSLQMTMKGLTIAVSTDDEEPPPDQTEVNPKDLPITNLSTRYLGALDAEGYEHGFLGEIPAERVLPPVINSTVSFVADPSAIRAAWGAVGGLVLDDVDQLEVCLKIALNNVKQPKSRFFL